MGAMDVIGLTGYVMSAIAYLLHIPEARGVDSVIIGLILLSLGYTLLASSKVVSIIIHSKDKDKEHYTDKKTDAEVLKEWTLATKERKNLLALFGNACLFLFFTLIHFIPGLTFHIRFYDIFAAIGYGLYVVSKWVKAIPMYVVALPLVMYYFFGAAIKFYDHGWISIFQMVARTLLMVYYATLPFV
jgi:hypothetical protein